MDARVAFALSLLIPVGGLAVSCGGAETPPAADPVTRARELAQRLTLVDTHIDVPYRLKEKMADVGLATEDGDFDYPRARAGGLDVAFMSIYVPASLQESGGAKQLADELIDLVEGIAASHPDKFALASSVEALRLRVAEGRIVLALGMENGAPIEDDLANLSHFASRGVRYITLAHSKSNAICDSSYDEERRWGGLSPFGREVVAEMNRVGIMVDVSHLTDDAARQAIEQSQAPVIASHSSCRRFTPGWERNLSDELIRQIAAKGGVVQINFGSGFVDEEYRGRWLARWQAVDDYLEEHLIAEDSEEARAYREAYDREHPIEPVDLAAVADHVDHVVSLVGIDHVGLGSDFDGLGDSLPRGLEDVSKYPNLLAELLRRGYAEAELEKIGSGNILRVWSEVEAVAERLRSATPTAPAATDP